MYKLLVVDDEPIIRKGIRTLISKEELNISQIFEASNGIEGLEVFKTQGPELVLLDINMPKMNGLELAEKIKSIAPDTKIALITGYDYFDYAVQGIKVGVDDYVLKPISKKDVVEVVKKLSDKRKIAEKEMAIEAIVGNIVNVNEDESDMKGKIENIITNNLTDNEFSLVFLSDQLGFSPNYLSSLFKKEFGVTFQDYILDLRMEKAKLLLLTTNMKNYEVAENVGITDVNYFGTRFKKKYGLSPKQYKLKIRDGKDEEK